MSHHTVGEAHYGNTIHQNDSFTTNIAALALFSFLVIPLFLNTPHLDFARGILVFGHKMASRMTSRLLSYTPVGLQRSVGDGSALKNVFGLDSGMLKSGLDALKGPKSNTPPGLGNCNNSCYQNSIIQVCTDQTANVHNKSNQTRAYPPSAAFASSCQTSLPESPRLAQLLRHCPMS